MNKRALEDINVKGKRVFCRVDVNVPMKEGVITDERRIKAALPTISYWIEQDGKVMLGTHLGRRKGEIVEELRLNPVQEAWSKELQQPLRKADAVYGPEVDSLIQELQNGDV